VLQPQSFLSILRWIRLDSERGGLVNRDSRCMVVGAALIRRSHPSLETILLGGWVASLGKSFQPLFNLQPCVASIVHLVSMLFFAFDIQVRPC
jgi:hypothetical protein